MEEEEEKAKRREEKRSQVGKTHELGSKGEEGRKKGGGGCERVAEKDKSAGQRGRTLANREQVLTLRQKKCVQ